MPRRSRYLGRLGDSAMSLVRAVALHLSCGGGGWVAQSAIVTAAWAHALTPPMRTMYFVDRMLFVSYETGW